VSVAEDLKTPGEPLREARLARQLSLADVAQRTKIPERLLAALEQDQYQKVSGALYVKSFLRNYAGAVGLDPEELLELYHRHPDAQEEPSPGPPPAEDLGPPEIKPPPFLPQTIGRPPAHQASVGGEVWQEEVQVQRLGLSTGAKLGIWLVGLLVLIVLVVLLVRALGGGAAGRTEPPAAPAQEQVTGQETAAEPAAEQNVAEPTSQQPGHAEPAGRDQQARYAALERDTLVVGEPPASPTSLAAGAANMALPVAPTAGPGLPLAGVEQPPLVLRMLFGPCHSHVRCSPDSQSEPVVATWPAGGEPAPLPEIGIEPDTPYAVRGGYVIYYWARDHFLIRISDRECLPQISLNGHVVAIPAGVLGRDWLVDAASIRR
jgi:transcriptional regulator with XRE-family HTH domain